MKTYTQAEVDAMLAARGNKPIEVKLVDGISKKTNKPYSGVRITGNFPPQYLSRTVALAIVEAYPALRAALKV